MFWSSWGKVNCHEATKLSFSCASYRELRFNMIQWVRAIFALRSIEVRISDFMNRYTAITLLSFVDHKYVRRFLENCNLGPWAWADNGTALLIKALSLWHHRCGCASLITFHSVQTILRKKTLVRNGNTCTKRHDNSHRASRRWANANFSLILHPTHCLESNKVRGTSGDIFEGYHPSLSADINSLFAGWTTARIKPCG